MPIRQREIDMAAGLLPEIRAADGPSYGIDMMVAFVVAAFGAQPVGRTGEFVPPVYGADLKDVLAPRAYSAERSVARALFDAFLPEAVVESGAGGRGGWARVTVGGVGVEIHAANEALALVGALFTSLDPEREPETAPGAPR